MIEIKGEIFKDGIKIGIIKSIDLEDYELQQLINKSAIDNEYLIFRDLNGNSNINFTIPDL